MWWLIRPGWGRTLVALLLLAALWPTLVLALPLREAGVVTTLSGKASIARVSLPQSVPLHFKDPVYLGDKISTAENSIVRVLLGGKALVTVRELSVFRITEEAGKSTVGLTSGKISLAVARQRMAPGESVEVRTPNAVAAVRGTVLVVEVEPAQTAAATPEPAVIMSTITVIKGTVIAGSLKAPNSVTLNALQSVKVVGQTVGTVQNVSPATVTQLLRNLKPPQQFTENDDNTKKRVSKAEQAKALALAKVLAPDLFPEQEEDQKKKEESRAGEEGQSQNGNGDDQLLADASSQIGTQVSDASAGLTTTATGLLSQASAPVVSTTQLTDGLQQIINPPLPPPPSLPLIIPPDQTINTNMTFSAATHLLGGLLDGTGTVTVTGLYDWQGGSMLGAGVTVAGGGLTLSGAGTKTLNRALSVAGTGTLAAGTLSGTGSLTVTGGTFDAVTSGTTYNLTGGTGVTGGAATLGGAGVTLTNLGPVTVGSGTLTINTTPANSSTTLTQNGGTLAGNGNLTFTGASTWSGGTQSGAGTTTALGGLAIGGNVTLSRTVNVSGTSDIQGDFTISGTGALSNAGTLAKTSGSGTATINPAFTNSGTVDVQSGTLLLNGSGTHTGNFGVTGVLEFGGGSHTISGIVSGSGAVRVSGGTTTLSGANTYTGATSITGGTLQLGAAGVLADATAMTVTTPGVLDLNSFNETIGSLAGSGNVTLGSATLTTGGNNGTTAYSGIISGTGGLTKAGTGTLTLSGANTYDGATSVSAGTLRVTNATALGSTTGVTTVASGTTLELNGNITVAESVTLNTGTLAGVSTPTLSGTLTLGAGTNTVAVAAGVDTLTLGGVLSGAGDLNKTGLGMLTVANTGLLYRLSGKTTVSGGTLSTTGNLVSIPTGETQTITDTMLHANGGVLDVDQSVIRVPFSAGPVGIVQANGTNPLVLLTGNTHTLASTAGTAMFDFAGNSANTTTETIDLGLPGNALGDDVTLTLATDRPLRGAGSVGCVTSNCVTKTLLEASGATVSGEKLMKVDAALLEATVPIVRLLAVGTLTLSGDAVTLANMAKIVAGTGLASAMFTLDGSSMTINVGALINASGGSFLNVLGDLVRLSNTSTLTLNDASAGYLMRVSGGSVVDIAGSLIEFTGTAGNKVKLANTYNLINNPTETFLDLLGIRVHLTGNATASQVEILGTPISGLGTNGTIENLAGVAFTGSLIEVNGTAARVRIKGSP